MVVEVGGSGARVAVAGSDGPVQRRATSFGRVALRPTVDDMLDRVLAAVHDHPGAPPRRLAMAWPGPVTPHGDVLASPTVASGVAALPLGRRLATALHLDDVAVINDVTAAGMALVDRGQRDFVVVTVGSGIGNTVFVGGRPIEGPNGRGGEIGHLVVDPSPAAPRCMCGGRGHLGGIAGGRAIVAAGAALVQPLPSARHVAGTTPPDGTDPAHARAVVAAYLEGRPDVVELVNRRAGLLGWALAALHVGVGVERFLLTGGFAIAAGEPFRRAVARGGAGHAWDLGLDWDEAVRLAAIGPDPGLTGAWVVARDRGWVPAVA